ncbi:hypothetical protein TNCV_1641161 [Trichonephila clavipes]|nr:hypothetical protein TNCV_1641161 [Trichonephila clavipes]
MDLQNFDAKLQQHMAELKPLKSPSNRKQNIFVPKDLKSCSHVFIRIDRVKKVLEPPYEGPYAVQKKPSLPNVFCFVSTLPRGQATINLIKLEKLEVGLGSTRCGGHLNDSKSIMASQMTQNITYVFV